MEKINFWKNSVWAFHSDILNMGTQTNFGVPKSLWSTNYVHKNSATVQSHVAHYMCVSK